MYKTNDIINTIVRLSETAGQILDTPTITPDEAFTRVKHFLGSYCDSPADATAPLDSQTLQSSREYIKTSPDGYYSAIEFLDIDFDPLQSLAEYLEDAGHEKEAELLWPVVDFVKEIRQWVCHQTDTAPDLPYTAYRQQPQGEKETLTQDQFLALFDPKTCNPHKARLLLDHILEVSGEKSVHTYYGALAAECQRWFKTNERDFVNLIRRFLSVAGLDPVLADNVRQTKLGKKVLTRAKEKYDEIDRTRARK